MKICKLFPIQSKTYFIYRVDEPGSQQDGRLKLYIQPSLQQNVNANSVLIRRYVKDPNYILFEGVKPSGGTPGGLIHPEFITERMRKNLTFTLFVKMDSYTRNHREIKYLSAHFKLIR